MADFRLSTRYVDYDFRSRQNLALTKGKTELQTNQELCYNTINELTSDAKYLEADLQKCKDDIYHSVAQHEAPVKRNKVLWQKLERPSRNIQFTGIICYDKQDSERHAVNKMSQLSELKYQLQKASTKLKKIDDKLQKAQIERDREICTRKELERSGELDKYKILSLEQRIQTLETEHERKIEEDMTRIKELEDSRNENVSSQGKTTRGLMNEIEHRDKEIKDLKEIIDSTQNQISETDKLQKDIKKKEEQIAELTEQRQYALTKLKFTEDKLNETKYERDLEQVTLQEQNTKTKKDQTGINEIEGTHEQIIASLNQTIQHLQGDIELRDNKLKILQNKLDYRNAEAEKDRELINDSQKKEDLLYQQSNQIKHAMTKIKETEDKLMATASERDNERHNRQDLERKAKENHSRIKELEHLNDKIAAPLKQTIQKLERELELRDLKLKELEELSEISKAEVRSGNEYGNILREKANQLTQLEDRLKEALVKLKETENELDQTKTRLSKAMGDRLTDNNPNIADLSDKNRPVKLAERYAELYDNQWTDAFGILGKYFNREQSTIEALMKILQDVMDFCNATGSKQMENLLSDLGFFNTPGGDVRTDVRKHLKDCRKAMSSIAIKNLYERYVSLCQTSASQIPRRTLEEVSSFVQECLEICWLMVIQDPPVVFAPVSKQGSRLNTDLYRPYTSSGTHIEFTVWPALLLHEGGPVLAKGVAQGYGKKSSSAKVSTTKT